MWSITPPIYYLFCFSVEEKKILDLSLEDFTLKTHRIADKAYEKYEKEDWSSKTKER